MSKQKNTLLAPDVIRIDGGTQPREEIDIELVEDYADGYRHNDPMPPIDVFYDGVNYWLADGFHRWHAARKAEQAKIECIVHQGTQRDAILFSVSANSTHGKRRSNADKRRAVLTLLNDKEWSGWSDNVVASKCAVSQPFVSSIRNQLITVIGSTPAATKGADRQDSQAARGQQRQTAAIHAAEIHPAVVRRRHRRERTRTRTGTIQAKAIRLRSRNKPYLFMERLAVG